MRRLLAIVSFVVASSASAPAITQPQLSVQNTSGTLGGLLEFGGSDRWVAQMDAARVHVFEVASGRLIRTLEGAPPGGYNVVGFAAHPTEDVVFLGYGGTGAVTAWDVKTGTERWRARLPVPASSVATASLRLDSSTDALTIFHVDYAVKSGTDVFPPATVVKLKASTGELVGNVSRVGHPFLMPAGATDDRWYVGARLSGSRSFEYQVYEIGSERPIGRPQTRMPLVHSGARRAVLFDYTSTQFDLVDIETGTRLGTWEGAGLFSPDGSKLVLSVPQAAMAPHLADLSKKNEVPTWRVVDAMSGKVVADAPAGTRPGGLWILSRDGQRVATVRDGRLETMVVTAVPATGAAPAAPASAAPASEHPAAVVGADASLSAGRLAEAAGAFTDDGRWFVARARDGQFDVFDMATGTRIPFRLPAQTTAQSTVRLSGAFRVRENPDPAGNGLLWRPVVLSTGDLPIGADLCLDRVLDWQRLQTLQGDYSGVCRSSPDRTRLVVGLRGSSRSSGVLGRLPWVGSGAAIARRNNRDTLEWVVFDLTQHPKIKRIASLQATAVAAWQKVEWQFPVWSPDGRYIVVTAVLQPGRRVFAAWRSDTGQPVNLTAAGLADASFLGFVPGADQIVVRTDTQIRAVALSTPQTVLQLPVSAAGLTTNLAATLPGGLGDVINFAGNGSVWVGPDSNGVLWIRRAADAEVIGELRLSGNGEWLVTTPTGLFDGSPGGWQQIAWRTADGRVEPGELYFNEYFQPGLLADLLAGRVPRQVRPVVDADRRQPTVTLAAKVTGPQTARVVVGVRQAKGDQQSGGARDLRLFRNGVLVKIWRGELGNDPPDERLFTVDVPLVAGANRLVAYAFNRDNIKSTDAVAIVESGEKPRPATVHLVAVGIDRYTNSAFNLRYAAADAKAFAAEFERRQRALGAAQVNVVTLLDEEATRENVVFALARLSGTAAVAPAKPPAALTKLTRANPEDTVVVYFAGHGLGVGERFHLIPTDLGYAGPRENAAAALPSILAKAISDRDLEEVFEPLDARHIMLLIDACDSGLALEADEPRFGPMNSRGLAQLAYEKGMVILTASQAYQAALETQKLQHGYLTYALVEEGLKQFAADTFPKDGEVRSIEWVEFAASRVPALQLEAMHQADAEKRILKFQVGPSRDAGLLQTPRVFWRRDDVERAFLVARP